MYVVERTGGMEEELRDTLAEIDEDKDWYTCWLLSVPRRWLLGTAQAPKTSLSLRGLTLYLQG